MKRTRERERGTKEETRSERESPPQKRGRGARSDEQSTHEEEIRRGKRNRNGRHGENKEGGWRQDAREIREKSRASSLTGGGRRRRRKREGKGTPVAKRSRAGAEE